MKTIIAGSRDITDMRLVYAAVAASGISITEVVCGGARGVDEMGRRWAKENSVPLKIFLADWAGLGRSAGYRRNEEMAGYAEALIAIWDGKSKGTKHMIDIAEARGITTFVLMATDHKGQIGNGANEEAEG